MNAIATVRNAHDFTTGAERYRQIAVLDDNAIRARAASVFADSPMPGVSDKYQFVRTADVLGTLRNVGYEVVEASQSAAKTDDGRDYVKHQLRLMHADYISGKVVVGDTIPEVSLVNSHNRTSAFVLRAALKRLACNNGLMIAVGEMGSFRILHTDKAIHDHIVDGTELVREVHAQYALPTIAKMQEKELSEEQAREFALAATLLKWGEFRQNHIEPLLATRRAEDEGRSLWAVMNRVQENAVKGGYPTTDKANRRVQASGIMAVDRDIDFNAKLWQLTAKVLELA